MASGGVGCSCSSQEQTGSVLNKDATNGAQFPAKTLTLEDLYRPGFLPWGTDAQHQHHSERGFGIFWPRPLFTSVESESPRGPHLWKKLQGMLTRISAQRRWFRKQLPRAVWRSFDIQTVMLSPSSLPPLMESHRAPRCHSGGVLRGRMNCWVSGKRVLSKFCRSPMCKSLQLGTFTGVGQRQEMRAGDELTGFTPDSAFGVSALDFLGLRSPSC